MSELRTSGFFRPWHNSETTNRRDKISKIVTINDILRDTPCGKQEEDDDSIVSSAISTSSTSSTIAETSGKYVDNREQRTADSTSLNIVCRKRIRRGSESSDDVAISNTPSLEGEDVLGSTVQDATNKPCAFYTQQSIDSMPSVSPANPPRDSIECNGSDINSLDYLSTFEFRRSREHASISDGAYPMVANMDIAGPSSATIIPELCYALPNFHPGIHPGMESGINPVTQSPGILPAGFYNRSMEEAVQMVHRQDAVAKQMKKMRPKKFHCQYCDMAFSNNGQLKGHVRIHTGERPFKCDAENCDRTFTRNEELTRHKRIHTGVRPHACTICGKTFGRKDHLKKHTRTHEGRDPYRVSTAFNMFALGHQLQQATTLSYVYPIELFR